MQEARVKYRQQHDNDPTDTSAVLGYMKCMEAMGDWGDLVQLCNDSWDHINNPREDPASLRKAALLAARWVPTYSCCVLVCWLVSSFVHRVFRRRVKWNLRMRLVLARRYMHCGRALENKPVSPLTPMVHPMVHVPPLSSQHFVSSRASWSMGNWSKFEEFVEFTDENLPEGAYLRAVLALRKDDLDNCTR